mmetsp:Transcript_33794/g.38422  ORF Transcript_33794/g.38422 Transcript_33794/m.38422 type:complete len:520 (+) Transcript_33794:41-1600(+)
MESSAKVEVNSADNSHDKRHDHDRSSRSHFDSLTVDTDAAKSFKYVEKPVNSHSNWREIRTMGKHPSRRSYHSSVFHKDHLYVYGGTDLREGIASELHRLYVESEDDSEEWQELETTGSNPGGLTHHTCILYEGSLYLYGGTRKNGTEGNEIFKLDLNSLEWTTLKGKGVEGFEAPFVDDHTSVLWRASQKGQMVVFGGFINGQRTNQVWCYDIEGTSWSLLSAGGEDLKMFPAARNGHATTVVGDKMYVFGGCDEDLTKLNDLWEFSLTNQQWTHIDAQGDVPKGRTGHSLVHHDTRLFLFGGLGGITQEMNDVQVFHIDKSAWVVYEKQTLAADPVLSPNFVKQTKVTSATDLLGTDGGYDAVNHISLMNPVKLSDKTPRKKDGSPTKTNRSFKSGGSPVSGHTLRAKKKAKAKTGDGNKRGDGSLSPTTSAMKNSILLKVDGKSGTSSGMAGSPGKKKRFLNIYEGPAEPVSGRIKGKKPCPRDGHSVAVHDDKMYIFGGDRHHMPFNDLFVFNLF